LTKKAKDKILKAKPSTNLTMRKIVTGNYSTLKSYNKLSFMIQCLACWQWYYRDEAVSVFYFACFVPGFRSEFRKGGL